MDEDEAAQVTQAAAAAPEGYVLGPINVGGEEANA